MPLTDVEARQAKPKEKDYKLFDGGGLFLLVTKSGSKYWRLKYRFNGKEKTLALGVYPSVSLVKARDEASKANRQIREDHTDPSTTRRREKALRRLSTENTFSALAREWIDQNETWADSHRERIIHSLEKDVFQYIGDEPIAQITPPDLLAVIRRIESRGALDIASRILQRCGAIFRYAIQAGRATVNPATELRGVLKTRKVKHVASVSRDDLPELVRAINGYQHNPITRYALKFALLTFVRPGELRKSQWPEFDLEAARWRIPADRMKMGEEHIVPLSRQAIDVLNQVQAFTSHAQYVFHGERNTRKPMSENTLTSALHRMGFKGRATAHGFRATASSVLNEENFTPDAIERQLSHGERNQVRAAYNHHARYLDERTRMMQWWADYLDSLVNGGKIVPIRRAG